MSPGYLRTLQSEPQTFHLGVKHSEVEKTKCKMDYSRRKVHEDQIQDQKHHTAHFYRVFSKGSFTRSEQDIIVQENRKNHI